jgi:hypothetical protein
VTKHVTPQSEYEVPSRRIAGTREEKLDQIEDAIQELIAIKFLECGRDGAATQFLAAPRQSHWFAMTVTVLGMLALLVVLLGAHPGGAAR